MQDRIDYEALVQKSLRNVIRDVLDDAAKNGLPGEHHFYITFSTQAAGVEISARLKSRFPEAMTIVLQHRFRDMQVLADSFTVTLSFGGISEKLSIPFAAMQIFYDPAAAFEVAFNNAANAAAGEQAQPYEAEGVLAFPPQNHQAGHKNKTADSGAERLSPPAQIPQNPAAALSKREADSAQDTAENPSGDAAADSAQTAERAENMPRRQNGKQAGKAENSPQAAESDEAAPHSADAAAKKGKSASVVSLDAFRKK